MSGMKLFSKKITLFKKKDRETWQMIKSLLKDAGLTGIKASHYPIDSLSACGCGSKLDPRNFGVKGHIDRDVYFIDVREEDYDMNRIKALSNRKGFNNVVLGTHVSQKAEAKRKAGIYRECE